jgi:hypothetical protein
MGKNKMMRMQEENPLFGGKHIKYVVPQYLFIKLNSNKI